MQYRQESKPMPQHPQKTQEIWHITNVTYQFSQVHHWKHPIGGDASQLRDTHIRQKIQKLENTSDSREAAFLLLPDSLMDLIYEGSSNLPCCGPCIIFSLHFLCNGAHYSAFCSLSVLHYCTHEWYDHPYVWYDLPGLCAKQYFFIVSQYTSQ